MNNVSAIANKFYFSFNLGFYFSSGYFCYGKILSREYFFIS